MLTVGPAADDEDAGAEEGADDDGDAAAEDRDGDTEDRDGDTEADGEVLLEDAGDDAGDDACDDEAAPVAATEYRSVRSVPIRSSTWKIVAEATFAGVLKTAVDCFHAPLAARSVSQT
jgi:hypothetical protein